MGFGHLYAYHYMDERHVIEHSGVVVDVVDGEVAFKAVHENKAEEESAAKPAAAPL